MHSLLASLIPHEISAVFGQLVHDDELYAAERLRNAYAGRYGPAGGKPDRLEVRFDSGHILDTSLGGRLTDLLLQSHGLESRWQTLERENAEELYAIGPAPNITDVLYLGKTAEAHGDMWYPMTLHLFRSDSGTFFPAEGEVGRVARVRDLDWDALTPATQLIVHMVRQDMAAGAYRGTAYERLRTDGLPDGDVPCLTLDRR